MGNATVAGVEGDTAISDGSTPQGANIDPRFAANGLPTAAPVTGGNVLYMHHQIDQFVSQGSRNSQYPVTLSISPPGNNQSILSGKFRIRPYYRSTRSDGTTTANQSLSNAGQESGIYDQYITGSVQGDGSLQATISDRFASPVPNLQGEWSGTEGTLNVYYRVVAEYKLQVPEAEPIMVSNNDSISKWESRSLEIPGWINRTATSVLQSRINALSAQRNIRTVEFYLDQRDATRNAAVAGVQPGSLHCTTSYWYDCICDAY